MELFLLPLFFWFWLPLGLLLIFVLFLVALSITRSYRRMDERYRLTKSEIKSSTHASHELSDEIRRRREEHAQQMQAASLKLNGDESEETE